MIKYVYISKLIVKPLFLYISFVFFAACSPSDPSPPLSPSEALNSFVLADEDLQIELVAAEPLVQDPVAISFDEAGRLWVVEMLGFMSDIDGSGQHDKVGRVSVLFDDDKDGQMDRSIIFLDNLVLPRAIAIVKGGILVAENIPLWFAQDTNSDFKVDTKILVDLTYGGLGMPEHSANGLWRGMDNWLYNAKSKYRYKKIGGQWVREETEFRGQWGISHDDKGRLFYNYNWSQLHADLVPPNALQRNKNHTPSSGIDHGLTLERQIFPIRSNTAVNRGYVPGTLDNQGRLLEFASACSPLIYRGDALPADYLGNAFVCEPTANLVKRNKILEDGFMLSSEGVYKNREFLASADERFRPVSLASGPDGAIYVVDMYKGIIQDGPYMTEYLREETLKRKLDKPVHMGRIWRVTTKNRKDTPTPSFSNLDTKKLVKLLGSPNGWTRDMAQKLLVDKGDTIISHLKIALESPNPLAQLHALWTLEGLGLSNPDIYLTALKSTDLAVVQSTMRILEKNVSQNVQSKKALEEFIKENYPSSHPLVQMQMVLSSAKLDSKITFDVSNKFLMKYRQLPVARDVVLSSLQDNEMAMLDYLMLNPEWRKYDQNNEIFIEMLSTAISNKGEPGEIEQLFKLVDQNSTNENKWVQLAVINGLLNSRGNNEAGEIVLKQKPNFKIDDDISTALLKKLSWPGKPVDTVQENTDRPNIDMEIFAQGRQKYLNLCANCHGTQGEGVKRFAPPLKNSEWVNGEDYKLAMILLYGMEGPIEVNGKRYDIPDILPSMPSFSTLQNEDIAAIATYIRNSWGNSESQVESGSVGHIRFRTQGKIQPWNSRELDTLEFNMKL